MFFQFFVFFQFCDVAKVVIIGRSIKPNLAIKDRERQKKKPHVFFWKSGDFLKIFLKIPILANFLFKESLNLGQKISKFSHQCKTSQRKKVCAT
jgi:hypothetical protein